MYFFTYCEVPSYGDVLICSVHRRHCIGIVCPLRTCSQIQTLHHFAFSGRCRPTCAKRGLFDQLAFYLRTSRAHRRWLFSL